MTGDERFVDPLDAEDEEQVMERHEDRGGHEHEWDLAWAEQGEELKVDIVCSRCGRSVLCYGPLPEEDDECRGENPLGGRQVWSRREDGTITEV
jgi:hypothetical protein